MLITAAILFAIILVFAIYASFDIRSGIYVRAFCRGSTKSGHIALTFDDGPHPIYTPQVLDLLKQYNTKATFFVVGEKVAGNEEILKRMLVEGHLIGNHSFTHRNAFPLLGIKKINDELLRCEQIISQVTGYTPEWFRPPFGVTNPNIIRAVKIRGYRVAGWSIRSLDTLFEDKDKVVRRVVKRLNPGAVILLHDNLPNASGILEKILKEVVGKGYFFATVKQLQEEYSS